MNLKVDCGAYSAIHAPQTAFWPADDPQNATRPSAIFSSSVNTRIAVLRPAASRSNMRYHRSQLQYYDGSSYGKLMMSWSIRNLRLAIILSTSGGTKLDRSPSPPRPVTSNWAQTNRCDESPSAGCGRRSRNLVDPNDLGRT